MKHQALFPKIAATKIAADDTLLFTFIFLRIEGLMFHVNPLLGRGFT